MRCPCDIAGFASSLEQDTTALSTTCMQSDDPPLGPGYLPRLLLLWFAVRRLNPTPCTSNPLHSLEPQYDCDPHDTAPGRKSGIAGMEGAAAAAVVEDAAAAADGHPQPAAAGVAAASDPGQEAEEDGLSGLMRGMVRRMLHRILARHAPDRGALLYGGVRQGRPVGAAAFYLHDRLVKG